MAAAAARTRATLFKRCVTVTIVSGTFFSVFQDFIGFVDFFEFRFCFIIIRIAVRVILHGKFTKGTF